jgi:hypothetical protein
MRCRSVREWLRELSTHPTPRKLSDYLRGELLAVAAEPDAEGESPRRRHLRRCERCREHVRRALQYWSLLALYCRDVTPGPAFEARVAARIRGSGEARRRAAAEARDDLALSAVEGAKRAARRPRAALRAAEGSEVSEEERRLYRTAPSEGAVLAWLLALTGPDAGADRPLASGETTIGSDPSCDVVLDDPSIAPRHASIVCAASAAGLACFVLDHGAPGGTFVNGGDERVPWARLEDGDVLRFGALRMKFKALAGAPIG